MVKWYISQGKISMLRNTVYNRPHIIYIRLDYSDVIPRINLVGRNQGNYNPNIDVIQTFLYPLS